MNDQANQKRIGASLDGGCQGCARILPASRHDHVRFSDAVLYVLLVLGTAGGGCGGRGGAPAGDDGFLHGWRSGTIHHSDRTAHWHV